MNKITNFKTKKGKNIQNMVGQWVKKCQHLKKTILQKLGPKPQSGIVKKLTF